MLWLLGYLIIGMIYSSIHMQSALRKMLKKENYDEKVQAILVGAMLLLVCIFTLLWPAFLTMKIASVLRKGSDTSVK
ncbi:hypothetical protein [Bacillus sp. Fil]|uniref:hypothetical protein n=1 Tax=Bacillus sp. Fil TaxID=3459567 RepID=UPI00403AC637